MRSNLLALQVHLERIGTDRWIERSDHFHHAAAVALGTHLHTVCSIASASLVCSTIYGYSHSDDRSGQKEHLGGVRRGLTIWALTCLSLQTDIPLASAVLEMESFLTCNRRLPPWGRSLRRQIG